MDDTTARPSVAVGAGLDFEAVRALVEEIRVSRALTPELDLDVRALQTVNTPTLQVLLAAARDLADVRVVGVGDELRKDLELLGAWPHLEAVVHGGA